MEGYGCARCQPPVHDGDATCSATLIACPPAQTHTRHTHTCTPPQALHSFRDNRTTLLLATPSAARGLDLPALSHVYNVGPPEDATAYLHRAGRTGRIGSTVQGVITTLVTREQLTDLQRMVRARVGGMEVLLPRGCMPSGCCGPRRCIVIFLWADLPSPALACS